MPRRQVVSRPWRERSCYAIDSPSGAELAQRTPRRTGWHAPSCTSDGLPPDANRLTWVITGFSRIHIAFYFVYSLEHKMAHI